MMLNNKEKTKARLKEINPAARGRNRFVGCCLSFSISTKSLMMYTALETMQKQTKASVHLYNKWTAWFKLSIVQASPIVNKKAK
jgi:hypothetical protein